MLRASATRGRRGLTPGLFPSGLKGVRTERQSDPLPSRLRLLSFNIQAAIGSNSYRDYVTGSWKHLLAHGESRDTLQQIAALIAGYDIVALQEVDGGSLRSHHINQLSYLAESSGMPFWHQQLNRNLGRFGQYSNGLLSKLVPFQLEEHRLPGLPGRGALLSFYGTLDDPLVVVNVHLALGQRIRSLQLAYLRRLLRGSRRLVVMGDFNCQARDLLASPLRDLGLEPVTSGAASYPSWSPQKRLDHILVTQALQVTRATVLSGCQLSDHLPVALEVRL